MKDFTKLGSYSDLERAAGGIRQFYGGEKKELRAAGFLRWEIYSENGRKLTPVVIKIKDKFLFGLEEK